MKIYEVFKIKYYAAFVLDEESRTMLQNLYPPKYSDFVGHHVTIAFDISPDFTLPNHASLEIIGYVDDGSLEAFLVSVNGNTQRNDGKIYHCTWSREYYRTSAESNEAIKNALPIETPISINTVPQILETELKF